MCAGACLIWDVRRLRSVSLSLANGYGPRSSYLLMCQLESQEMAERVDVILTGLVQVSEPRAQTSHSRAKQLE